MSKGTLTRQAILDHALDLATEVGLEGLSIGRLADDLHLSKSGLFAHFGSKEALQVQVLEAASARFVELVLKPSLSASRGEPRLRSLFEHWLRWPKTCGLRGGCLFVAVATELDDRPGPARDRLVQIQKDWLDHLAHAAHIATAEGHFRPDADPAQFAHELYGIMLVGHHVGRLLRDPESERRTRTAFESLLFRFRKEPPCPN
ncbi:MAG TPA: TetR/AcrR family transcriptional regulator [Candidatus Xenobia bacterium]